MHHIDMPVDYHVRDAMQAGTLSKTHAKARQRYVEIKDRFVDDTE